MSGRWPGQRMMLGMVCAGIAGCGGGSQPAPSGARFGADLAFLREHTNIVLLTDAAGAAQVAVAPAYQGRVMTSTNGGPDAPSFGWIGRTAIQSGERQPHMNVFGGEDRFWLGPEGGQYALYFKRGDPFDLEHWQTPEPFDWGPWDIASQSATQVSFRKQMALVNYSGTSLDVAVERSVRLLTPAEIASHLGSAVGGEVRVVAFESSNTVTNTGSAPWLPESGLVSIWILGQFTPSPPPTISIPLSPGP